MTDPREPLADPHRERLAEPHLRHRHTRPPAEFSPHIRVLIYTAVVLGVVLAIGVYVWVFTSWWHLP